MLLAVFTLLALSSCVYDDVSDCPPLRQISFKVAKDPNVVEVKSLGANARKKPQKLDKAVVYMYNKAKKLVHEQAFEPMYMDTGYLLEGYFTDDQYSFVVVGNADESYELNPVENFDQSYFGLKVTEVDQTNKLMAPMYHSYLKDQAVTYVDEEKNDNDVASVVGAPLTPNIYQINLTVKGVTGVNFAYRITDTNSRYNFENNYLGNAPKVTYLKKLSIEPGGSDLVGSLRTLRIGDGRSPLLTITNEDAGTTVYPMSDEWDNDLVSLIKKAYFANGQTLDFKREHTFDIELELQQDLTVKITVNNWEFILDNEIELNPM